MTNYLQNLAENEKLKQINSVVKQYSSAAIKIQYTETNGLGIFLQENINSREKIFSYDLKKIISSKQINQGLFFQNSLYMNHARLKINRRTLVKSEYTQIILMTINIYYHFRRIKDSFLKDDLAGLPIKKSVPFMKVTPFERQMFKNNLNVHIVDQYKEKTMIEYNQLIQSLSLILCEQSFIYYLQSDNITITEYLYIQMIRNSRQHIINKNSYIFPILHYTNQISNIQRGTYETFNIHHKNKYVIYSTNQIQYKYNEYLINYGYNSISSYAFISGFVPMIYDLKCVQFQLNSTKKKVSCVDFEKLLQYSVELLEQFKKKSNIQVSFINIKQIQQDYNHFKHLLLHNNQFQKYLTIIMSNLKFNIESLISLQESFILELEIYLNYRKDNKKDIDIVSLLIDYQKYYLKQMIRSQKSFYYFLQYFDLQLD